VTREARFAPGAPAAAGDIPLAVPFLGENEWAYVKEALDTNWVSSVGPFVDRFEREVAARVDSPHAVAVSSGTAALHLALLLAGVGAGDEVVMPALTFAAPAFAVTYVGAAPVFVDVEPDHWQLDVDKVAQFLEHECSFEGGRLVNRRTGGRIAALLPVHALGHPVDFDALAEVAARYELPVVEDAAEAMGALYRGRAPGTLGLLGCLSFNGNKVITTGGGGMILTADAELAARAHYLSTQAKDDPVEYVHGEIGFNYRMSNILAAIGCAQLEVLDRNVEARRRIALAYADGFESVDGLSHMREASWAYCAYWLSTIRVDAARFGIDSRELLRRLAQQGIQTRPLWQPLHLARPFAGATAYRCDVAEIVGREALSLPSSSGLSEADQARVVAAVVREKSG
jgi:perosamine synthetase